jgi:biopolymer transport protein ExbD
MAFKQRLRPSAEFSASSIADLVFLLLIFFLLTSQFVTQHGVHVDLPKSKSEKPTQGDVSVTIAKDGTYMWQDEELGEGKSREEKEALVVAKIDEYLQDTTRESRVINLRGDTAISYGAAAVIIAAVSKHGGAVAIQTKE